MRRFIKDLWRDCLSEFGPFAPLIFLLVCLLAVLVRPFVWLAEHAPDNKDGIKNIWRLLVMTAQRKSFWAVALNRKFVEIREAKRKPRAVRTEFEKDSFYPVRELINREDGNYHYRTRRIPHKLTLSNTVHIGGKVVKAIDNVTFWRLTQVSIPPGEVYKLSVAQALKVLGKRRTNASMD